MKTMQELVSAIQAKGFPTEDLTEAQVRELGKVLKLEVPPKERTVEIAEYKGRQYVKTDGYPLGKGADGKEQTARGLFLEVRALDQAIADLQAAQALVASAASQS